MSSDPLADGHKVFIVVESYDYAGSSNIGVFARQEDAEACAAERRKPYVIESTGKSIPLAGDCRIDVEEWDVD